MNRRSLSSLSLCLLAPLAACEGKIFAPTGLTNGGGSGGGPVPSIDAGPPAFPYEPVTASASVTKVKNLLTGLPPSDAEVAAVQANPQALKQLVAEWITLPQYQQKMLTFFGSAFQQNASALTDFESQETYAIFAGDNGTNENLMLANYHEMFPRTVMELINEGRPFTEAYTTTRFMLTPALAGGMAALDSQLVDDNGLTTDKNLLDGGPNPGYPDFSFALETSKGQVPSAQVIDPNSPNYLQFYTPSLAGETPSVCTQDPQPYKIWNVGNFEQGFFGMFMGLPFQMGLNQSTYNYPGPSDGGIACPPADTSGITYRDFEHWRMVNIRQPNVGERTTPYFDYDTIRSGSELVFKIPRVGYFTTPSFVAIWGTNSSNQFRVTMNQTLIVGLNQAFDGTDGTVPQSGASIDSSHASQTTCFACHQQLDPMRQFFRHDFSLNMHEQTLQTPDNLAPPEFAWAGVSQQGTSIADLGTLLSQQPHVAATWVQNLCEWANSAPCLESDPEFLRIVQVFVRSNFSWNAMVTELFASPLITYGSATQTSGAAGENFGIARQAHLCALLSERLGITDVCGLEPSTNVPGNLRPVQTIISSYPSDAFSRGQVGPVLANDPSLFMRTGLENSCIAIANQVVDNGASKYSSSQPQVAINDFVHNLMALTSDRADPMINLLNAHYAEALATPTEDGGQTINATAALRSTFVVACLSPYVAGLGQ